MARRSPTQPRWLNARHSVASRSRVKVDEMRRERPERALAWRLALRETLRDAFAANYIARDFAHQGARCWYVLERD